MFPILKFFLLLFCIICINLGLLRLQKLVFCGARGGSLRLLLID